MKYPRINNWLVFRRTGRDEYEVEDCLYDQCYDMGYDIGYFAKRLDGRTDPYSIYPKCPREQIDELLEILDDNGLLRRKRVLQSGFGTVLLTLWIPKWTRRGRIFAAIMNFLLQISWLPMLIAGAAAMMFRQFYLTMDGMLAGYFTGLFLGMLLHELGHAFAGVAYGGRMFEMGVMTQFFLLPGAYVLIDVKDIKSRMQRAQTHGAGVEMNFLLSGLSLILTTCIYSLSGFFLGMAMVNLVLGLMNLTFARGLDGMAIFSDLFGEEDIIKKAQDIIRSKEKRRRLQKKGISGAATIAACRLLMALRFGMPLIIIINFLEVFLWITGA